MPDSRIHDPALAFRFQVLAREGAVSAGFSKVSGLRDESEVVEYREGTDPLVKRKIPGIRTFPALVMERGMMIDALGLIEWRRDAIKCVGKFHSGVKVTIYNCDQEPARQVDFNRAWPNALALADLDGGASEVNIESVEFVHEGVIADTLFSRGGTPLKVGQGSG